jgi:hypothetical protein
MPADDRSLMQLPPDLPVPENDGGAAHLPGQALPPVALPSTQGGRRDLASLGERAVVFAHPRTGSRARAAELRVARPPAAQARHAAAARRRDRRRDLPVFPPDEAAAAALARLESPGS